MLPLVQEDPFVRRQRALWRESVIAVLLEERRMTGADPDLRYAEGMFSLFFPRRKEIECHYYDDPHPFLDFLGEGVARDFLDRANVILGLPERTHASVLTAWMEGERVLFAVTASLPSGLVCDVHPAFEANCARCRALVTEEDETYWESKPANDLDTLLETLRASAATWKNEVLAERNRRRADSTTSSLFVLSKVRGKA